MDRLDAKVMAYNRAGKVANELFPQLVTIFKQFEGQKVCKADGSLTKKVRELLPKVDRLEDNPNVMYYRNSSNYSISFTVKACARTEGIGSYAERTIYICKIANGVVEFNSWEQEPNFRTDYNADKIRQLRKVYEQKKREADDAQGALFPFGEYDN